MARFVCKCGEQFNKQHRLVEHVALRNPRWPRISEKDEHSYVEALKKKKIPVGNVEPRVTV